MLEQILAIIRNTFFESIRQPIMLVLLVVATLLLILANPLSAFTMEDDQRMLIDIGMATIFMTGALLAAFVATNVLSREIENKTALTVVSKPVGRPLFVIGKFLGVAIALMVATAMMSLVFMLVEMHTVMQTVRDPIHLPVILFGVGSAVVGVAVAVWCNYFYGKVFSSTVICITTPLLGLAYFFSLLFRYDFTRQPIEAAFKPDLWLAILPLMMAIMVLTAIAIAASTRLGQVMTLVVTLLAFLVGMMSDYLFGRPMSRLRDRWLDRAREEGLTRTDEVQRWIELINPGSGPRPEAPVELVEVATVPLTQFAEGGEMLVYAMLWLVRAVVPNFQILWLTDAITQGHKIPISHVIDTLLYGAGFVVATLALATILFQRREVG